MRHSPELATSATTESDEAPAHDAARKTEEPPPRPESTQKSRTRKRKGKEETTGSSTSKKAARAGKGTRTPHESQVASSAMETTAGDNTNEYTQPPPSRNVRRPRPSLFNDSGAGRRLVYMTPDINRLDEA
ncbi:hypothetical protein AAVH_39835 [Aphelenchoides avenae]|nr:hypothetical protein AAVH_39835 [Aphelenchus avenae]